MSKIAVVLIRGLVGIRSDIKEALKLLRLEKKHACVIVESSPSILGSLKKVQDYVTFGEVSEDVIKQLIEKRAKDKEAGEKSVFFLAPPVGGFERKGIKKSFVVGGALGDRKDAINKLLLKMI